MYFYINCTKFIQLTSKFIAPVILAVLSSACSSPAAVKHHSLHNSSSSHHKSELVAKAHLLLGTPYRYGGNRPSTGFDCSGFVQYAHATVGIELPRTSRKQYRMGKQIKKRNLRAGDLVFFRIDTKKTISHVGIYIGNNKFIHAPSSGKRVSIARLDNPYWQQHYDSARRIF